MRAIILAAGRGSRMGGMTEAGPKCLTPLAGRALLDWQRAALRAAGVDEIGIVRGYRGDRIPLDGCTAFDNPRWAATNMVATLACAADWLRAGDCLVSYSDIVYHPDVVRDLLALPGGLAISYDRDWSALWSQRFADPLEDAETFRLRDDGCLAAIGARAESSAQIEGQFMGLLRFDPKGWEQVEALRAALPEGDRDRLDSTTLLQRLIESGADLRAVATDGRWCEVDTETDLRAYEQAIERAERWSHDWRWEASVPA